MYCNIFYPPISAELKKWVLNLQKNEYCGIEFNCKQSVFCLPVVTVDGCCVFVEYSPEPCRTLSLVRFFIFSTITQVG